MVDEARVAHTGAGSAGIFALRSGDLFSRAMDRDRTSDDGGPSSEKIDAFLGADFATGDDPPLPPHTEPDKGRKRITALVFAPIVAVLVLFLMVQLNDDSDAPLPEVSGATELPTLPVDVADDRVLPRDATQLEILHQTLPPDGGLYSVVVEIRNGSDVAIPISLLTIEVEAFGVRIDPLDVRYDNELLAAGGSTVAAIRVELPANSSPAIVASFEGETIARTEIG